MKRFSSMILILAYGCSLTGPTSHREIASIKSKNTSILGEYTLMKTIIGKCSTKLSIESIDDSFIVSRISQEVPKPIIEVIPLTKTSRGDSIIESTHINNVLDVKTTKVQRRLIGLPVKKETIREIYQNKNDVLSYKLTDGAKKDEEILANCDFQKIAPTQFEVTPPVTPSLPEVSQDIDYEASEVFLTKNEWQITGKAPSFFLVEDYDLLVKDENSEKILQKILGCGLSVAGFKCLDAQDDLFNIQAQKREKGFRHLLMVDTANNVVVVTKVYAQKEEVKISGIRVARFNKGTKIPQVMEAYFKNELELLLDIKSVNVVTKENVSRLVNEADDMTLFYHLVQNARNFGIKEEVLNQAILKNLKQILEVKDPNYILGYLNEARKSRQPDIALPLANVHFESKVPGIKYLSAILLSENGEKSPAIKAALIAGFTDSKDWTIRRDAVKEFEKFVESSSDVSLLITKVKDSDSDVSKLAYNLAIKQEITEANLPELLSLKSSTSYTIRLYSIDLLNKLPQPTPRPHIISMVGDSDSDVQSKALKIALTYSLVEQDIIPIEKLASNTNWVVRKHSVALLSKIQSEKIKPSLLKLVGDPDSDVSNSAYNVATNLNYTDVDLPLLAPIIDHQKYDIRLKGINIVAKIESVPAKNILIHKLADSDGDVQKRAEVLLKLKKLDASNIEAFKVPLGSSNWSARLKAVGLLGTIKNLEADKLIIRRMIDSDSSVAGAAFSLAKVMALTPDHIESIKVPGSSTSWSHRRNAIDLLGKINLPEADKEIVRFLVDSDDDCRNTALKYLKARVPHESYIPEYAKYASSMPGSVAGEVAAIMAKNPIPATEEVMKKICSSSDWSARKKCTLSLESFTSPAMIALIIEKFKDTDEDVRKSAYAVIAKKPLGTAELDDFAGLKSAAVDAKVQGLIQLSRIGIEATESILLFKSDTNWSVRLQTVKALGTLNTERAVGEIIKMITDSDSDVRAAVTTLVNAATLQESHLSELGALLNASDWSQRRFAAVQIGRINSPKSVEILQARLAIEKDSDVIRTIQVAIQGLR